MIFTCTIKGRPIVKKNTQKVITIRRKKAGLRFGKRPTTKRVIYSPQFLQWEFNAVMDMRQAFKGEMITEPMKLVLRFYFKDRQAEADTSNLVEGVQDTLKKAGVIKDDKLVVKLEAEKFFGSEPRVEIEIWKLTAARREGE